MKITALPSPPRSSAASRSAPVPPRPHRWPERPSGGPAGVTQVRMTHSERMMMKKRMMHKKMMKRRMMKRKMMMNRM